MDIATTALEATVSTWQERVGRPALRSSRLVFGLCAAFAAPLHALAGLQPVAFHLYGPTAWRRDTYQGEAPLHLASCLYGSMSQVQFWENIARDPVRASLVPDDGLLLGIEFTSARLLDVSRAAALLWAEKPGTYPCTLRRDAITLSSGDKLLDQQSLQLVDASGKIRWFNIPADAGAGNGIFDQVAGEADAAMITCAAAQSNGQVGLAWLRYLNEASRGVVAEWKAKDAALDESRSGPFDAVTWRDPHTGLDSDEITECFGRLGDAGELATEQGLTGWPAGAAQLAVFMCMTATLNAGVDRVRVMSPRSIA